MNELNRRGFLKRSGMIGGALLLGMEGGSVMAKSGSPVTLMKTADRKEGVKVSLKALKINPVKGKTVLSSRNSTRLTPRQAPPTTIPWSL